MIRRAHVLLLLGTVALIMVLSPIIYLLFGPVLDRWAREHATATCEKIVVGAPAEILHVIAKENDARLLKGHEDKDGGAIYQLMFMGLLANGFSCDAYVLNGKVSAKRTDEHTW